MRDSLRMKCAVGAAGRVIGVLPWIALLALFVSAFYVRLWFGRWPRTYFDTVEAPFVDLAIYATILSVVSSLMVLPPTVLLLGSRGVLKIRPVLDRWLLSSWIGAAVLYSIAQWDPYGVIDWAFD